MGIRLRGTEYHYEFMQNGKRYYGVCEGCTTKPKAIEYEKKIKMTVKDLAAQKTVKGLVENRKRDLIGGVDITLADAFDVYLTKPAKRHPGDMRREVNRRHWEDFVAFMSERYPDITRLDQVAKKHAEAYIDYLRNEGRFIRAVPCGKGKRKKQYVPKKTKLSKRTINEYHTILKSVFRRLADEAGIVANPFGFETMKATSESRDIFSLEELKLIDEGLHTDPFCRPLFIIGANTGLSLGDVCTLQWGDIRYGEQGNFICRRRNKTNASLEIPIMPVVQELLAELEGQREEMEEEQRSPYILPEHERMYRENRSGVSYRINRFLRGLGIQTTRETTGARVASTKDYHSLRHTFAYLAGVNHIPLAIVQAVLGHMSPQMTQHYQEHATRADKVSFLKTLPALVGNHLALPEMERQKSLREPLRIAVRRLVDKLSPEQLSEILERYGQNENG